MLRTILQFFFVVFSLPFLSVVDGRLSMIAGGRVAAIRAGQRAAARRTGGATYNGGGYRSSAARRERRVSAPAVVPAAPAPKRVNHREDEVPAPKRAKGKTPGWGCFLCGGKNMPVEDED